jgi:putative acetyltransferase
MLTLRPLMPEDNAAMRALILDCLLEHGCTGRGFASDDPELDDLCTAYQQAGAAYWVLADEETGQVLGGAGYAPLKGGPSSVAELQKLYFAPDLRGQGWGRRLVRFLMTLARRDGYQRLYLETVPQMHSALRVYKALGFESLTEPLGNTGHTACTVYQVCDLVPEGTRRRRKLLSKP